MSRVRKRRERPSTAYRKDERSEGRGFSVARGGREDERRERREILTSESRFRGFSAKFENAKNTWSIQPEWEVIVSAKPDPANDPTEKELASVRSLFLSFPPPSRLLSSQRGESKTLALTTNNPSIENGNNPVK